MAEKNDYGICNLFKVKDLVLRCKIAGVRVHPLDIVFLYRVPRGRARRSTWNSRDFGNVNLHGSRGKMINHSMEN